MAKPICVVCKKDIQETGGCLHERGWWHHIACPVDPEDVDAQYKAMQEGYWE